MFLTTWADVLAASFQNLFYGLVAFLPNLLVAVIIFIPMVGLGAYPGMLAIGVHSVGTLGKLSAGSVMGGRDRMVEEGGE